MNKFLYYFLQLTWGIIQNILGFLIYIFLFLKNPRRIRGNFFNSKVITWHLQGSAGIGMFIFLSDRSSHFKRVLVHEYGHTIQSCILGPFYLLVIGIPSFIWAHNKRFERNRIRGLYRYSSFYPERWANYLGEKYTGLSSIRH